MAKISIDSHSIGFNDSYFFDTNIWLLLYGTVADFQKSEQSKYSKLFSNIIEKNKPIYITSLVCSEFSNVLLRRDFNLWKEKNSFYDKNFKKDFEPTFQDYPFPLKEGIYNFTDPIQNKAAREGNKNYNESN